MSDMPTDDALQDLAWPEPELPRADLAASIKKECTESLRPSRGMSATTRTVLSLALAIVIVVVFGVLSVDRPEGPLRAALFGAAGWAVVQALVLVTGFLRPPGRRGAASKRLALAVVVPVFFLAYLAFAASKQLPLGEFFTAGPRRRRVGLRPACALVRRHLRRRNPLPVAWHGSPISGDLGSTGWARRWPRRGRDHWRDLSQRRNLAPVARPWRRRDHACRRGRPRGSTRAFAMSKPERAAPARDTERAPRSSKSKRRTRAGSRHTSGDQPKSSNVFRALLFVGALGVGLALVAKKPSGPPVGDIAAEFNLRSADGTSRVKLSDLRGKPVVVEVFASWCTACRRAAPMLREAALSKREKEVHFVGVSVDRDRRVAAQLKQAWDIPYEVVHDDGSVASKYRIQVLPTFIVIDAEGHVRHVSSGAPRSEALESWLGDLGAARL